jgi:YD repeat-containing protein
LQQTCAYNALGQRVENSLVGWNTLEFAYNPYGERVDSLLNLKRFFFLERVKGKPLSF